MGAILLGIGMFMFLVIIHELGHFLAAKKTGVKVLEFGIGIPPKAFRRWKDKEGTEYTINRIPLGGFVRLKGENPDDEGTFLAKDSFVTVGLWRKLLILFAGVIVNAIAAWLLFSIAFMKGITPISLMPENTAMGESRSYLMPTYNFLQESGMLVGEKEELPARIEFLYPDGLAAQAGLASGDVLLSVAGKDVTNYTLSEVLGTQFAKTFDVVFERGNIQEVVSVTCPEDACILGVSVSMGGEQEIVPATFSGMEAFVMGAREIREQTRLTFSMLGSLGSDLLSFEREKVSDSVNKLSGPVGIVKVGEAIFSARGIWMYLAFAGMISLALAIFNILPIPALDGGRALGVLIQEIFRLEPKQYFVIESYFNIFFFVVLMCIGVYVILLDLVRFWGVHIPGVG